MPLPYELTTDQKIAVDSDANMVITACPGSGKTSVVVEKIRKDVENLSKYQGIIGITFSVKASRELSKRCKRNAFDTKSSFFDTIDHFCLSEIIYPFASRIYGKSKRQVECKSYLDLEDSDKSLLPNLSEAGINFRNSDYEKYSIQFKEHYRSGFILLEAVGIIANNILKSSLGCQRYLKARYKAVYMDEYQDTSEPQHELFLNLMSLGLKAVAVGDTNQSIYIFRGSNPEYIQDLVSREGVFEHHIVNKNHRCHPSITNYSNRLFNSDCKLIETDELRIFHLIYQGSQLDLSERLNVSIKKAMKKFDVKNLSDVAVLVRHNKSLNYLKQKLTIPFRVNEDDVLSTRKTSASKLFVELLHFKYNYNVLMHDIESFALSKDTLTQSQLIDLKNAIKLLRDDKVVGLTKEMIHIAENLLNIEVEDQDVSALKALLEDEDAINRYRRNDLDEVQVMSLHKSKGLEFEIVFHLDLYDWVFPYREFTRNFNKPLYPTWEQELNLHFVGITRARKACVLAYSKQRLNKQGEIKNGVASPFLELEGIKGLFRTEVYKPN